MSLEQSGLLSPPTRIVQVGPTSVISIPPEQFERLDYFDYRQFISDIGALHRSGAISRLIELELPSGGWINYYIVRDGVFVGVLRDGVIDMTLSAQGMCTLRVRLRPFHERVEDHDRDVVDLDCSFLSLGSRRLRWAYRSESGGRSSNIGVFFEPEKLRDTVGPGLHPPLDTLLEAGEADDAQAHLITVPTSRPLLRAAEALMVLDSGDPACLLRAEARTLELLAEALGSVATDTRDKTGRHLNGSDIACLEAVRERLDRDPASSATLDDLARDAGLNRRKLTEGFKNLFGSTVHEYRSARRMARACGLLEKGVKVAAVAGHVGYSDQSSFTTAFKRHLGETPTEYRSRLRR